MALWRTPLSCEKSLPNHSFLLQISCRKRFLEIPLCPLARPWIPDDVEVEVLHRRLFPHLWRPSFCFTGPMVPYYFEDDMNRPRVTRRSSLARSRTLIADAGGSSMVVSATRPTMRTLGSLFRAPTTVGFESMGKREGCGVLDYIVTGLDEPRRFESKIPPLDHHGIRWSLLELVSIGS